jgi:hypothetical protein
MVSPVPLLEPEAVWGDDLGDVVDGVLGSDVFGELDLYAAGGFVDEVEVGGEPECGDQGG